MCLVCLCGCVAGGQACGGLASTITEKDRKQSNTSRPSRVGMITVKGCLDKFIDIYLTNLIRNIHVTPVVIGKRRRYEQSIGKNF
jgi:hypothetical protein